MISSPLSRFRSRAPPLKVAVANNGPADRGDLCTPKRALNPKWKESQPRISPCRRACLACACMACPLALLLTLTLGDLLFEVLKLGFSGKRIFAQEERFEKPCNPANWTVHEQSPETTRGMVTCVSPINQNLEGLVVLLAFMRRRFGGVLPVEAYHVGEIDERRAYAATRYAARNDVKLNVVDLTEVLAGHSISGRERLRYFQSFHCKPVALAHTCFDEAILFDTDIIPLHDLRELFEVAEYKRTGSLFFHDYRFEQSSGRTPASFELLEELYSNLWSDLHGHEVMVGKLLEESPVFQRVSADVQESSVVLLNRWKHQKLREVLMWIYEDRNRIERVCGSKSKRRGVFHNEHVHGDKELFWLSAALAREEVSFSPWAGSVFNPCQSIFAQYDPGERDNPRVMWINGNKFWQMMSVQREGYVGCPRKFDETLPLGKRCGDKCDLERTEFEALLDFKFFSCRANILTAQLCWPMRWGYSMDFLNVKFMAPLWRNAKFFRSYLKNIL